MILQLLQEFCEVSTNEELKPMFEQGYQQFWFQNQIPILCPALCATIQKLLIAFPSSYLVELEFNPVTSLITRKRNRQQISARGDLRMLLTQMEPNINKLKISHQIHPSHE